MTIGLTEKAANEIKRILASQNLPVGSGLRVGVKGGGCSGYSYSLGLDPEPAEGDQVFEASGIRIFCDPKSHTLLQGMTIDWQDSLMGRGFVFQNPNAKHSCGCGESFSV